MTKYPTLFAGLIFLAISVILIGKGINESGGAGAALVACGFPFFLLAAFLLLA